MNALSSTNGKIGDEMKPMKIVEKTVDPATGTLSNKLPDWLLSYLSPMNALSSTMTLGLFYSRLRPTSEFVMPTQFSKPANASDAILRLRTNLRHFWANYAVIILIITFISIITSPMLLLVMALFTWMWSKVLDDEFALFKFKLDRRSKIGMMSILSALGMIYFASSTIIWSLGTGGILAGAHAAFPLPPALEDDDPMDGDDLELGFLSTDP